MTANHNQRRSGSRRSILRTLLAGSALAPGDGIGSAFARMPRNARIRPIPGDPALLLARYDLASVGLAVREFCLSGRATAFGLASRARPDGDWHAKPASTAGFSTRLVVLRPEDPARFNGTAIVEWLNVTAGQDMPIFWLASHREIVRKGYAYVAVSAQRAGIDGDSGALQLGDGNLRNQDPVRYAGLSHPGDAYAYDIFSRAGEAIRGAAANGILDGLVPQRIVAAGESQSAMFLTTYLNAIDPIAKVYDGFFVHSRFGGAAAIDGSEKGVSTDGPRFVRFRDNPRVPVMAAITETDLLGVGFAGYHGARRDDGPNLRVWEIAGSSHGDNYLFGGALRDSGVPSAPAPQTFFTSPDPARVGTGASGLNPGMSHHYVIQAALFRLEKWIRRGHAPPSFPPIELESREPVPQLVLDEFGIARGGVRTPWVDVPTLRLSGAGTPGSFISMFGGSGEPLGETRLRALYPDGSEDYLARFRIALASAIRSGAILRDDEREILALAAHQFPPATQ